jgi:hypothetical protein
MAGVEVKLHAYLSSTLYRDGQLRAGVALTLGKDHLYPLDAAPESIQILPRMSSHWPITLLLSKIPCLIRVVIIIIINGTAAQSRAFASLTGFVMILLCGLSAPRST